MKRVLTTAIGTGIIALFIFAQIGFAVPTAIESQASPVVSVEPSCQKVASGEIFTVNITVYPEGSEVYGASYTLYFNNTLLNATGLTQGTFLSQDGAETYLWVDEINNTLGKVEYAESRKKTTSGVNTSGVLTTITFQAIAEHGASELCLSDLDGVILSDPLSYPILTKVNNGSVEIAQPSSSFLIFGYVYYRNDTEYNNPKVNITNLNTSLNTSKEWKAETHPDYNYYQLVLTPCTDIVAGEILQFNVTSPDGKLSNITNYMVTQNDINNGGLFNFNITLEAKLGIFDTGAPDSPYPSIMGVHNGTITPNRRIEVNRIYTYACPGTGGHTEYARIWGNGVNAHANWSGYSADWHNLTFNTSFTLEPGVEYSFTIRTGSYPQIIHHPGEYNATGGKIICDEFTDANGKKYTGWIPAIKLWREEE